MIQLRSNSNGWASALAVILVFVCGPTVNAGLPGPIFWTAAGGDIPDEGIGVFPLFMTNPQTPYLPSLELDIIGLAHDDPWDLDIYLIDPFGTMLEIMTDRGDSAPIAGVSLTFSDTAVGFVSQAGPIVSGIYLPEGPPGFAQYVGGSGGTDAWILLMIDDAPGDTGSFESFTLGYIPEPAALLLMTIGALLLPGARRSTLRRRHHSHDRCV